MKKILLFTYACLFLLTTASAEKRLKRPLTFVPADSIVFLSQDISNLRLLALATDSTARPARITIGKAERKAFEKNLRTWQEHMASHFNLVGGMGDELVNPQILPAAAMLHESATLFLQTADAKFANTISRIVHNTLPTALGSPVEAERQMGARALSDAAGMIYATDTEGVYINFYTNSYGYIHTPHLHLSLDVQTFMPFEGRVKVRVGGMKKGRHEFKLRFLIPEWCRAEISPATRYTAVPDKKEQLIVYINGRDEELKAENGYVEITRAWRNGDEVYFDLPFPILTIRPVVCDSLTSGVVALQRGPLVYALPRSVNEWYFDAEQPIRIDYSEQVANVPCLAGQLKAKKSTSESTEVPKTSFVAVPYAIFRGQVWLEESQ